MPFKLHSKGRRHIPRQRHRVTNWREYDVCLRNRGNLTIWFTPDAIAGWKAQPRTTPGGQRHYSNLAIETALTLRAVFRLALRQSEGLIGSIMRRLEIDLPIPDHTTLSRRACGLPVQTPRRNRTSDLHLIVDSTGLKLRGAGEWLFEKHGTAKRRAWRKLHIGIDAGSGEIVAFDLTNKDVDDASHVETVLEQLDEPPASFMADGAYDRASVLDAVLAGNPSARFVVPPCKGAVTGPTGVGNGLGCFAGFSAKIAVAIVISVLLSFERRQLRSVSSSRPRHPISMPLRAAARRGQLRGAKNSKSGFIPNLEDREA